jgi:hypothetical protein
VRSRESRQSFPESPDAVVGRDETTGMTWSHHKMRCPRTEKSVMNKQK